MKFKKMNSLNEGATVEENKLNEGAKSAMDSTTMADWEKNAERVLSGKGAIEKALDLAYNTNRRQVAYTNETEDERFRGTPEFLNVMLVGEAGAGKTARIKAWCKSRGVKFFGKKAGSLDAGDLGGAMMGDLEGHKAVKLSTSEFDRALGQAGEDGLPNVVMFVDEFNRAGELTDQLLTLINDHVIDDNRELEGERVLPGLCFVAAAINPEHYSGNTQRLDPAMVDRFVMVKVETDDEEVLEYNTDRLESEARWAEAKGDKELAGKIKNVLGIVTTVIKDPDFHWTSTATTSKNKIERLSTPRGMSKLAEATISEDGTKETFLGLWKSMMNPADFAVVQHALGDYKDIDDVANNVVTNSGNMDSFRTGQSKAQARLSRTRKQ